MAEDERALGSVVWLELGRYPWWPAKVEISQEEAGYLTFQDKCWYGKDEIKASKVRSYNCAELVDMIVDGRRKLESQNKAKTLEYYLEALKEAELYIQGNLDSSFLLPASTFLPSERGKPRKARKTKGKERTSMAEPPQSSSLPEESSTHGDLADVSKDEESPSLVVGASPSPLADSTNGVEANGAEGELKRGVKRRLNGSAGKKKKKKKKPRLLGDEEKGLGEDVKEDREERDDETTSPTHLPPNLETTPSQQSPPLSPPSSPSPPSPQHSPPPAAEKTTPRYCPYMSSSEDDNHLDSSDSDSSAGLPSFNSSFHKKFNVFDLSPKEVVWAKYQNFPFWPAMVARPSKYKTKSKFSVDIYFFGESTLTKLKIRNPRNLFPYEYEHTEKFSRVGKEKLTKEADCKKFLLALDEVKEFFRESARCETAAEAMQEVMRRRGTGVSSSMAVEEREDEGGDDEDEGGDDEDDGIAAALPVPPPPSSPKPSSSFTVAANVDSSESDFSEEAEDNDNKEEIGPYTYDRVVKEMELLKPVLVGIMRGEVHSDLHTVFTSGSRKEKEMLRLSEKHGPLQRWKEYEVARLVRTVLLDKVVKKAEGSSFGLTYAYDVLLPEAMMRVKAVLEDIPIEQAVEEFGS